MTNNDFSTFQKIGIGIAAGVGIAIGFLAINKGEGYVRDRGIIRKFTKEEVNYREPYFVPLTNLYYKCVDCVSFAEDGISCKLVEGGISGEAGCDRWAGIKAYQQLHREAKLGKDLPMDESITSRKTY